MVTGLTTMPDSNFFTERTWATCSSIVRFLWITPMPPCWAMAIAIGPSLTVSIAAASSGMFSADAARQAGAGVGAAGQHLGVGGHHQHVVEGERFGDTGAGIGSAEGLHDPR